MFKVDMLTDALESICLSCTRAEWITEYTVYYPKILIYQLSSNLSNFKDFL